jgi:hypothetical protein
MIGRTGNYGPASIVSGRSSVTIPDGTVGTAVLDVPAPNCQEGFPAFANVLPVPTEADLFAPPPGLAIVAATLGGVANAIRVIVEIQSIVGELTIDFTWTYSVVNP